MKQFTQEQFYQIMTIVNHHLSNHREYLYQEYGYTSKTEGRIEELESRIKSDLRQFTHLDD